MCLRVYLVLTTAGSRVKPSSIARAYFVYLSYKRLLSSAPPPPRVQATEVEEEKEPVGLKSRVFDVINMRGRGRGGRGYEKIEFPTWNGRRG